MFKFKNQINELYYDFILFCHTNKSKNLKKILIKILKIILSSYDNDYFKKKFKIIPNELIMNSLSIKFLAICLNMNLYLQN